MKKLFTIFLILVALTGIGYGVKVVLEKQAEKNRIVEAKKGWHVEVLTEYINVREKPDRSSNTLGKVQKGDIFEVEDMNLESNNLDWYLVVLKDGTNGWIANDQKRTYLKDNNNPTDIATPTIKFNKDVYKVISISDIKYDHLITWDDKDDFEITHEVYYEKPKDQYWIKYTITDAAGKHASKTQKIEFEIKPSEDEVKDFSQHTRN